MTKKKWNKPTVKIGYEIYRCRNEMRFDFNVSNVTNSSARIHLLEELREGGDRQRGA